MPVLACLFLTFVQTDWKDYTLDGFGFRLPSPPVEKNSTGTAKRIRYWLSMHNGKNAIVIGITPLPPEARKMPDVQLAAAVAGSLAAPGSSLLAESDAWVSGWPALDYRYRDPSGLMSLVRIAVIDSRIVQIGVTGFSEVALAGPFRLAVAGIVLPIGTPKGPQSATGPTFAPYPLGGGPATIDLPRAPEVESVPVNDRPGALVLHRYASSYANRFYLAAYADFAETQRPSESERDKALRFINDDTIRSMKAQAAITTKVKLDDSDALATVAKVGNSGTVRIVSTFRGDRTYTLVAVVPTVWKDDPEVVRFFASFHFSAPPVSGGTQPSLQGTKGHALHPDSCRRTRV